MIYGVLLEKVYQLMEEEVKFMYLKINKMYKRVSTKEEAKEVITETLYQTEDFIKKFPEIVLYKLIAKKIKIIKEDVFIKKIQLDPFKAMLIERYKLGAIATKNFDIERDEYAQRISTISSLIYDYSNIPENKLKLNTKDRKNLIMK